MTSRLQSNTTSGAEHLRTRALLQAAAKRLHCPTVALLTATAEIRRLSHDDHAARARFERCVRSLRTMLLRRVIEQRRTFVAGSRAGRATQLVAVPVFAADSKAVAMLVALQIRPDPQFRSAALAALGRIAASLSKRISRARDTATVLSSWSGFLERLRFLRARAQRQIPVAVLYGNIDRLHLLNKARGMRAGDRVIELAALVIRRCLGAEPSAACRLSGDRFVIALLDKPLSHARVIADRIRQQFEHDASRLFGRVHALSFSFGVVLCEPEWDDVEQAVATAELACRAAKDRGRNRVETFASDDASMVKRHDDVDAIRLLRGALDDGRIIVYAQPIVPLADASLQYRYELLARLHDGERLIEPRTFLSAACRYQLLPDLDRAVTVRAFGQLRSVAANSDDLPFPISVNFSAPTICDERFVDWLISQLRRHALPPNQLTIELTESAAASSLAALQTVIERLRPLGVQFAIDDFGTGVNSLSYLKALNVDCIKLDGSYVHDLDKNARSQMLVQAIVKLAADMGITTVAEHVDSIALRRRVAELGVQYAQGFAVGRPEPLDVVLNEATRRWRRLQLATL